MSCAASIQPKEGLTVEQVLVEEEESRAAIALAREEPQAGEPVLEGEKAKAARAQAHEGLMVDPVPAKEEEPQSAIAPVKEEPRAHPALKGEKPDPASAQAEEGLLVGRVPAKEEEPQAAIAPMREEPGAEPVLEGEKPERGSAQAREELQVEPAQPSLPALPPSLALPKSWADLVDKDEEELAWMVNFLREEEAKAVRQQALGWHTAGGCQAVHPLLRSCHGLMLLARKTQGWRQ